MSIHQKSILNLPLSLVAAMLLTVIFFVAQPLLVKFSVPKDKKDRSHSVLISQRKPPPPQEFEEDKEMEQVKKADKPKDAAKQATKFSRPRIDMAMSGLSGGGVGLGTIEISTLLKQEFQVSDSLFVSAFKLNEVDQPPRTLRALPPRYPFDAKQKGITGRVVLRFVVDSNGNAQEPQVVSADPPGVFEEAALEAVVKYKFRPAMKGGKAVDCIVKLPISFDITE